MTYGDYYKFTTIINDGVKDIVNIIEVGTLSGVFITTDGRQLLILQKGKFLLRKDPRDCQKMSDGEAMLWKLEN